MTRKLWKDVWAFLNQDIAVDWSETTTGTVEAGKTVLDLAKALDENKQVKELAPLVGQISSLLDVLNNPLVQVAGTALPFVSIGTGILKFYLEQTQKEATLEVCVAIVSQAAYLESLRVFLNKPENQALRDQLIDRPASAPVARQIKALGETLQIDGKTFELNEPEAETTLVCFHESKLAVVFNAVLTARLQDAGLEPELAHRVTEQVSRSTHRYMKRTFAEARESVPPLAPLYGGDWQQDLEVYRSIDDYLETVIAQKPKEKVFGEDFGFEDIYVRLRVKPVDSNGEVLDEEAAQDVEDWALSLLREPDSKQVLFIQGGPGRGKSVFCRMFADRVRRELHPIWIPVLIRLRDIRQFDANFDQTLAAAVGTRFANSPDWLTDRNTRFLFVLDGFDELLLERGATRELQTFLEQVSLFQSRCAQFIERGHRVLITGRPIALHGIERQMPTNLQRVEIVPMEAEIRERWLERWAVLKGEEAKQGFQAFLEAENCPEQVQTLAQEPLLLYLLAKMHKAGSLNITMFEETDAVGVRIQIYEAALSLVLEEQRRDEIRGNLNTLLSRFEPEDLRSILAEAGLCVVQSRGECASIAMIEARLKRKEDEVAQDLLELAKEREDVLKNALAVFYLKAAAESEPRDPKVEFFHKSFGEFLCADRLKQSLVEWVERKGKDSRRSSFAVSKDKMEEQIYDLLGFGRLTPEIVEYLSALLQQQLSEVSQWATLMERLNDFYLDWSAGRFIEAIDNTKEPLPLSQSRWFKDQGIRLGQRQIDIFAGLNVLILLLELHRYAQSREDLKEQIAFHPCGKKDSEDFDETRLLRIMGYSESLVYAAFQVIVRAFLSYANLSYAKLSNANLFDTNLSYANLSYANLISANLISANLSYAKLINTDLISAKLFDTNLSYAKLINTDLSNTKLSYADLSNAKLSNANLSYADLSYANLSNANLNGTILLGTNLSSSKNLEQAQLTDPDHPPLLCATKLPDGMEGLADRDCDRLPQVLLDRYPDEFKTLDEAKQYVDNARNQQA